MIKFKEILQEEFSVNQVKQILNIDTTVDLLKNYCKISDITPKLFRGDESLDEDLYFINPKFEGHQSANTSNYYTMLLSSLPSWSKYPKRNKSIICSTYTKKAENYGTLYNVYPLNNTKLGICPDEDIWSSFLESLPYPHMNAFNIDLESIFMSYVVNGRINVDIEPSLNEEIFAQQMRQLTSQKIRKEYNEEKRFKKQNEEYEILGEELVKDFIESKQKNMFDYFNIVMSPQRNHFSLNNYNSLSSYGNREVWTDNFCVLIRNDSEFINEIQGRLLDKTIPIFKNNKSKYNTILKDKNDKI